MTQPTAEQLRLAREREFLLGQVSVDIEIALNKAGVLLTQEQGYIAAEAAIQATEARIAALEEKNAHLEWLLEGRDSFIVNKGLFPEFVDGLPRGSKTLGSE